MKLLRYPFKFILGLISISLLIWFLAWTTIAISLQTEMGQDWALRTIVRYIEHETDSQVHIEHISVTFPLKLRIKNLEIQKDNKTLLAIDQLDLVNLISALFDKKMIFSRFFAKGIFIGNFLNSNETSLQFDEANFQLPFYLRFDHFQIEDLTLDPELVKNLNISPQIAQEIEDSRFNLQGRLLNDTNNLIFYILLDIRNERMSPLPISLGFEKNETDLTITANCKKLDLKNLFDSFWSHSDATIELWSTAPYETWISLLQKQTAISPLTGKLNFYLYGQSNQTDLANLIGSHSSGKAKFQITQLDQIKLYDTEIQIDRAKIKTAAQFNLDGTIEFAQIKGQMSHFRGIESSLPVYIKDPKAFTFQGEISGSIWKPSIHLDLQTVSLCIQNQTCFDINTSIQAEVNQQLVQGNITLGFRYLDKNYQCLSDFKFNEERISVSRLAVDSPDFKMNGEGEFLFHKYIAMGSVEVSSQNIGFLSPYLNIPLKGQASGNVHLSADQAGMQRLTLDLNCQDSQWDVWKSQAITLHSYFPDFSFSKENQLFMDATLQNIEGPNFKCEGLIAKIDCLLNFDEKTVKQVRISSENNKLIWDQYSSDHAVLNATLDQLFQPEKGQLNFLATQILSPFGTLSELKGNSNVDLSQTTWPFQLSGKGHVNQDTTFDLSGNWHKQEDSIEMTLNSAIGSFGPYPFRLLEEFHSKFTQKSFFIEPIHFIWGEGEFNLLATKEAEYLTTKFQGHRIPSELFHFIAPELPFVGRVSFDGELQGPLDLIEGRLQIQLHHIQITENIFAAKPFIEGNIQLDLGKDGLNLNGILHGLGKNPVITQGNLPITASLSPLALTIHETHPFNLTLSAEGELDPYLHLFYNDISNLSGQTKIELALNGTYKNPQIRGTVQLFNGTYESFDTGAIYKNIEASIEGDGKNLILKNFIAEDNKQGKIQAQGYLTLDSANHFPFQFLIKPTQIFVMDSDYASISASGELLLEGNQQQGKLIGKLSSDHAVIHMEEALPKQIKSVEVKYINAQGDLHQHNQIKETQWPLELDLALDMPQVIIEGKNLQSEWKGEIQISGSPSNLLLNGELRVTAGEYDFNGKTFTLTQGQIHFAGSPAKKTSLYVVATKELERIRAEIIVKGPINKISLSFRSNPPLSQREVLSYILFNRGISDITTDQGDVLSHSFVELNADNSSQTDFLSRLRKNIGIDRLDFTSRDGENKDFGLQVGKYISENIFISLNKSINAATNTVAIEAKLIKNIQALAEVGDDAQGKLLLKWKRDY